MRKGVGMLSRQYSRASQDREGVDGHADCGPLVLRTPAVLHPERPLWATKPMFGNVTRTSVTKAELQLTRLITVLSGVAMGTNSERRQLP